mmetsp:Transcript_11109/g.24818  ORF Transcript_11109/g.24818 Transcript_11109/m.24818 type:complete len:631 (+) Transcript_11109:68-1960(+)
MRFSTFINLLAHASAVGGYLTKSEGSQLLTPDGWSMSRACRSCANGTWLGGGYTLNGCSVASGNSSHFFFKPVSGWCGHAETECVPVEARRKSCKGCSDEYGSCEDDVAYIFQRALEAPAPLATRLSASATSAATSKTFENLRMLSGTGLLATAKKSCGTHSSRNREKVLNMSIVEAWRDQFPDSVVQADDGNVGCFVAKSTASPTRILTLVDKTSKNICKEGPVLSHSDAVPFPVEGLMAMRAPTRNLFVVSPTEGTCTESSPCPVVVYLHGHNEHVTRLVASGDPAAIDEAWEKASSSGFMRYAHQEYCSKKLHSVFVFPQLLEDEGWTEEGPHILQDFVVPVIQRHVNGEVEGYWDTSRVAILGYSEGAFGAMHAATQHPDVFSLVVAAAPNRPDGAGGSTWELLPTPQETLEKPWLLKTFVATFGEVDEIGASDEALRTMMTQLKTTGVADRVNMHARLYMGLGHIHWDELFNQWRALHEALWLGNQGGTPTTADALELEGNSNATIGTADVLELEGDSNAAIGTLLLKGSAMTRVGRPHLKGEAMTANGSSQLKSNATTTTGKLHLKSKAKSATGKLYLKGNAEASTAKVPLKLNATSATGKLHVKGNSTTMTSKHQSKKHHAHA